MAEKQKRVRQDTKKKEDDLNMILIPDDTNMKFYFKDTKDTRKNLRGGGICKKGMNKKARGVNS